MSEGFLIRVDQVLHGYDEGHVKLAGSIDLPSDAASTMLVMSDLAPLETLTAHGWLTGYPLPKHDRYVIARTWPAPEKQRPGCVWTHSLLIDFADLAALPNLSALLESFYRPANDFRSYEVPLALSLPGKATRLPPAAYSSARQILSRLYSSNKTVHCLGLEKQAFEQAILAIWEQQWPRLRRRFRFVSTEVRTSDEVPPFDLQASAGFSVRGDRVSYNRDEWLIAALADLRSGGGPLRQSVRQMAIDVSGGRRAFPLLFATALATSRKLRPSDARALVEAVSQRLPEQEGQTAKTRIIEALARQPGMLRGRNLDFVLDNLTLVSSVQTSTAIARAAMREDPDFLWTRVLSSPNGATIAQEVLRSLDAKQLLTVAAAPEADLALVLKSRDDLPLLPGVWQSQRIARSLLAEADRDEALLRPVLDSLFANERLDLALELSNHAARSTMLDVYTTWERTQTRATERTGFHGRWFLATTEDEQTAIAYLRGEFRLRPSIVLLARNRFPLSYAEHGGGDLWFDAWDTSAGVVQPADLEYFCAFVVVRACLLPSARQEEVLSNALLGLLSYAARGLNDRQTIGLLREAFGSPALRPFRFFVDEIDRILEGLAKFAVRNRLPLATFLQRAPIAVAERLLRELYWQHASKNYLKELLKELEARGIKSNKLQRLKKAAA